MCVFPPTEFRVLNLRQVRQVGPRRKRFVRAALPPPREKQMAVDQSWDAVWTGPRTFHPASVPLPVRQGFTPKGVPAPGKYANTELMKIPNFLHLTPPVVKRQCEALKAFCTAWPQGLETDAQIEQHFPVEILTSDYLHALPTIRNPMSRIVALKVRLATLPLDKHARDKFLRLVGDRYDAVTDVVTIVTDRCPLRQQNLDYAQYLLTAVLHESWVTEPWEATKTEADMEEYVWERNASRRAAEAIVAWAQKSGASSESVVPVEYAQSVERLMNDGENEYNLQKYKEGVLKLLGLTEFK